MREALRSMLRRARRSEDPKATHELEFWRAQAAREGRGGALGNSHYKALFTDMFDVDLDFYRGKRLLDIGCGPRGSLEWADVADRRVGLDPLCPAYREFRIDDHQMEYVAASAERIPFETGYFDVVSTLNSLDHVDDLDATVAEIARVTRPGGSLLLEVEVGHDPTPTEPISLTFDVLEMLQSHFDVVLDRRYEMPPEGHYVHAAYTANRLYDANRSKHAGVLVARLVRGSN